MVWAGSGSHTRFGRRFGTSFDRTVVLDGLAQVLKTIDVPGVFFLKNGVSRRRWPAEVVGDQKLDQNEPNFKKLTLALILFR